MGVSSNIGRLRRHRAGSALLHLISRPPACGSTIYRRSRPSYILASRPWEHDLLAIDAVLHPGLPPVGARFIGDRGRPTSWPPACGSTIYRRSRPSYILASRLWEHDLSAIEAVLHPGLPPVGARFIGDRGRPSGKLQDHIMDQVELVVGACLALLLAQAEGALLAPG